MKKLLLVTVLSLSVMACDRHDKPHSHDTQTTTTTTREERTDYANDNTGKNIRDRDLTTRTPMDQSESEADRVITQKIRKAIMDDDTLSTNAKNIKIITNDGAVTLRGPVGSFQEKDLIERRVHGIPGITGVNNQLEITRSNNQ